MTAFGGLFRAPKVEGIEESDESGERARFVGLDLESGVVRVRPARADQESPEDTSPEE